MASHIPVTRYPFSLSYLEHKPLVDENGLSSVSHTILQIVKACRLSHFCFLRDPHTS